MWDNRKEKQRIRLLIRTMRRLGQVFMVLAGVVVLFTVKGYFRNTDGYRSTAIEGTWYIDADGMRSMKDFSLRSDWDISSFFSGLAGLVALAVSLGIAGAVLTILPRKLALRWGIEDEWSQHPRTDLPSDQEGSVLFLRSFRADRDGYLHRAIMPMLSGIAGAISNDQSTLEEDLVAAVSPIGPVVAIERPGERMPCLGAQRVSIIADDWRDEVDRRAMAARLVLIRYGETEGVHWEIERMLEIVDRRRLLIFVKGRRAYEQFETKIEQLTGQSIATPKKKLMDWLNSVGLFICFSDRGTPSVLTTTRPPAEKFTPMLNGLRWSSERTIDFSAALTPLYKRFKVAPPIRWEAKRKPLFRRIPWGRILLVLAVLIVGGISIMGIMRMLG